MSISYDDNHYTMGTSSRLYEYTASSIFVQIRMRLWLLVTDIHYPDFTHVLTTCIIHDAMNRILNFNTDTQGWLGNDKVQNPSFHLWYWSVPCTTTSQSTLWLPFISTYSLLDTSWIDNCSTMSWSKPSSTQCLNDEELCICKLLHDF